MFENLYSGNLREGLSFVDTQGKTKTLVFMMSSSIIFGFKVSSWTLHISYEDKTLVFLFENLYSGNLREGLSFIDTQGKTKTLVFMVSSSIIFGFKVSSWTLHITTKTKP